MVLGFGITLTQSVVFLPFSEHTYRQAPYQDCSKEEYEEALKTIPQEVDWALLSNYEHWITQSDTRVKLVLLVTEDVK